MAIGTAAAIIGSAVIGAGASALSSRSAANKAAKAANYAADQNAAVSREIYNQTRSDLAPYNEAGKGALNALMVRLGITPMSGAPGSPTRPQTQPATTPAGAQVGGSRPSVIAGQGFGGYGPADAALGPTAKAATMTAATPGPSAPASGPLAAPTAAPEAQPATGGGVDYQRLFQDRPDVMAEYQRVSAQADPNSPAFAQHGLDRGAEGFADWWLQNKPAGDTYSAPTTPASGAQPTGPADPNAPPPEYYSEQYAQRPDALPIQNYDRAPAREFVDYGQGPQVTDFIDPSKFQVDPGYQFRLKEGLGAVNAASAARRNLRSGDAAKALQARGEGLANQGYNDWYARQLQAFNAARGTFQDNRGYGTDQTRYLQGRDDSNFIDDRSYGTNLRFQEQGRRDNIFSEDRGFSANRNDQATANLFNVVGVGQGAAGGAANAGNVFAQNTIANNNARANTTANAAIANSQNTANLFGSAANAIGTYYGMRGSGGGMPRSYSI